MKLTSVLRVLSGAYAEKFVKYGTFSPTPLSLAKLASFGETANMAKSAKFLREELPVRLANIMQEIHLLPDNLIRTPSASLVVSWYEKSFCDLIDFEKIDLNNEENLKNFTDCCAKIRDRHAHVVHTMAEGVMELKDRYGIDILVNNQVQYFLDRFYMMRISIRMLINQHVLLFGKQLDTHRPYLGSIDPQCDVLEILQHAYEDAKYLCQHYYAGAPEIKFTIHDSKDVNRSKVNLVYVPSHLYHISFELTKNAMRAIMENPEHQSHELPPINVLITHGDEDITIK
ncbi:[Pyruvate dehydrogenase (acetyl-transferring)] kinase isozyme 4, partial [Cichlidogyrus casuarinus]